jgi:uncharacterized protein (TIGR03437 family)
VNSLRALLIVTLIVAGAWLFPHLAEQSVSTTQLLVFTKTTGFRHDSIPDGLAAIRQLGQQHGFAVDHTEDAAQFNDANLSRYQTVVFLCTTGEILDNEQQAAFERFICNGGGFVGVHSASDTEYDWAWYGGLVGAYFRSHPTTQRGLIKIEDEQHPSTIGLPRQWERFDEWYDFRLNPRGRVHVLATLDEATYQGGLMGADHPIAWCQLYDGGRAWYSAGGHTRESYNEPLFRQHLLGGIQFAAKIKDGQCSALTTTSAASFKPEVLASESIASLFGVALATTTQAATNTPLPTTLAGVSLKVRDSAGGERLAPLFFISPTQINYLMPSGTAAGGALITVVKADGTAPSGATHIAPFAPALFAANANGQGVAAGVVLRVSNNVRSFEPLARFDASQNRFVAVPIDLGSPDNEVFLVLFGTGIRGLPPQAVAHLRVSDFNLPTIYAGAQGELLGLDQVNVRLPRELNNRGEVEIVFASDGQTSNVVRAIIK